MFAFYCWEAHKLGWNGIGTETLEIVESRKSNDPSGLPFYHTTLFSARGDLVNFRKSIFAYQ